MRPLAIRTATLRPDVALTFDIYLLISGKHLLYVKRSDQLERLRLEKLKEKNVRQVFIDDNDKGAYFDFLDSAAKSALESTGTPLDARVGVIAGQSAAALEELFADPRPRENYERTRLAAANQVSLLLRHPEALEHVIAIAKYDRTVYQHSVNVAAIAVALGAAVGAPLETCNALGLGALMHDLGKSPAATSSATEGTPHEQHPRLGASLLLGKKYVSQDVLDIILLHEERIDGKGYPAGVKKLSQIFQVVGLANMYDRSVTIEGQEPRAAYDAIAKLMPAPYDERLIAGLKDVLSANRIY
ncbi:MAG: HD domain-containing protein [Deltaproteobacteria bacterium]|nr:HD domain-containing protein [Deltaproteobacteria bacterium]